MAVPTDAKIFLESMDPRDIVEYEINLAPLLLPGEGVASYSLSTPTESAVLGLEIKNTGGYGTTITDNVVTVWLGVLEAEQGNAAFTLGVILPIEVEIVTNATPPRRKQRTVAVKVVQR